MRVLIIYASLFLFATQFISCTNEKRSCDSPNIIYILADDLGYGDVAAFNMNSKIKTPFLDKMASEGMMFTDAHTTSSVCTPTRYSILTGRYNWRTKLKSSVLTGKSKALIREDRSTVASILKSKGYSTAFIGKWHIGWDWVLTTEKFGGQGWDYRELDNIDYSKPIKNGPIDIGFDYSYCIPASLDIPPYVYVENNNVVETPDTITKDIGSLSAWREGPTAKSFIHEETNHHFFEKARKYIKEQSTKSTPFFLYFALSSPHTPILPTKEWQGKSNINPYSDFVMMIDDCIGQLNATIREVGIEENTIVIFTSDNGYAPYAGLKELEDAGHFPSSIYRGYKSDIFEGGNRVPFIVKWPGKIISGSVCNQTISTVDFMATCSDIVSYDLLDNEGEDSYSMLPLLFDVNSSSYKREATVMHSIDGSFAIRKGDWKLITCSGSGGWSDPQTIDKAAMDSLPPMQLYNLADDPCEKYNCYYINKIKVDELKNLLAKYIRDGRSTSGYNQKNDPYNLDWKQTYFIDE